MKLLIVPSTYLATVLKKSILIISTVSSKSIAGTPAKGLNASWLPISVANATTPLRKSIRSTWRMIYRDYWKKFPKGHVRNCCSSPHQAKKGIDSSSWSMLSSKNYYIFRLKNLKISAWLQYRRLTMKSGALTHRVNKSHLQSQRKKVRVSRRRGRGSTRNHPAWNRSTPIRRAKTALASVLIYPTKTTTIVLIFSKSLRAKTIVRSWNLTRPLCACEKKWMWWWTQTTRC